MGQLVLADGHTGTADGACGRRMALGTADGADGTGTEMVLADGTLEQPTVQTRMAEALGTADGPALGTGIARVMDGTRIADGGV